MSRWRLTRPHYLWVPGSEWEYKETSRETGRQARKVFPVPQLLNPEDPADCNYPGELIVCHEGKGNKRDYIFTGPPTPDMEPLDEEAEKLSEEASKHWRHPIDSLPGDFTQSILNDFQRQIDALQMKAPMPTPTNGTVDKKDFDELKALVATLVKENATLKAAAQPKRA